MKTVYSKIWMSRSILSIISLQAQVTSHIDKELMERLERYIYEIEFPSSYSTAVNTDLIEEEK